MSNITCILDACSVINLVHIDEDEFLKKKVDKFDIRINELVFEEINKNIYKRLELIRLRKQADTQEINNIRKYIDIQLGYFRNKKTLNSLIFKEVGDDYFDKINEITEHSKKHNGELHSTALALYLSRSESKKIYFYTDDFPAKDEFSPFFEFQQIGQIKDSVDFLLLLFWIDESFNEAELDKFLSKLFSEYATEVSFLEKELKNYKETNIDANYIKSKPKESIENLNKLIYKLSIHDFSNITIHKDYFNQNKLKFKTINDILNKYDSVFELQTTSNDILKKISSYRKQLKNKKIYKLLDLCS